MTFLDFYPENFKMLSKMLKTFDTPDQCCGLGSGLGRIRIILPDPDWIFDIAEKDKAL